MRSLVLALFPLAGIRGLDEAACRVLTAPGTALVITGSASVLSHSSSVRQEGP